MDIFLFDVCITKYLFNGFHCLAEEVQVELLKLGTGKRLREIVTVLERLDLDASALLGTERALGLLDFAFQFTEGTKVS